MAKTYRSYAQTISNGQGNAQRKNNRSVQRSLRHTPITDLNNLDEEMFADLEAEQRTTSYSRFIYDD